MMEWVVDVALAIMFGMCALSMLRMMLGGWLRGGSRSSYRMMSASRGAEGKAETVDAGLLEELRTERTRLDLLIARADRTRVARSED